MSFFGFLTPSVPEWTKDLMLDLGTFTCGHTQLGKPPDARDFFAAPLAGKDVFEIEGEGFEVGTEGGVLDYYFITIPYFHGSYSYRGNSLLLDETISPETVQTLIGTPYWIDRKDKELILFYEFNRGAVELQFEFPDRKHLGFITLMRNGVLSIREQRDSYRVTASWPPPEI